MSLDKTKTQIIAALKALEAEVTKLAPHPDKPEHRGLIYAKSDSRASSCSQDGMVGSLIAEQLVGAAFGGMVPTALESVDISNVIDAYEEFSVDRAKSREGLKRAAFLSFNGAATGSAYKALEKAFEGDLPKRIQLERQYMALSNKLDKVEIEMRPSLEHKLDLELKNEQKRQLNAA